MNLNTYKKLPIQMKASIWFLVCSFFQKGITVISTPIFTRLLSTTEYGNFSVFNSWLGIVTVFVTMDIYYGVYTQGLVKFEDRRSVFSSSLQGLTLTLSIAWTLVYIAFRKSINAITGLSTVQMLSMLVMIWATAVFNFWSAEQRTEYKYKKLVIITIIVSVLKPAIGVLFVVLADDKVTARILGLAIVELAGYLALFIVQMHRGKVFFSQEFWSYALKINIPLVPHYLSQIILSSSDRIMIKNLVGSSEAGIYSLAYSISQIMILFNTALSQTITPWMYKKIKERKVLEIGKIAYLSMAFVAILNLMLILAAPEIVRLFAPVEYHEAIWIIPPVAMSVFFLYMYDFFSRFEFYYEKTVFIMFASIFGAILNIVLNYVFIHICGYIAAGFTTLFCYIIYVGLHYWNMSKIAKKEFGNLRIYDLKIIILISSVFCICGFIFMLTYKTVIIRYVIGFFMVLLIFIRRKELIKIVKHLFQLKKQ